MINFLRRIRQNLLKENKFSKYLIYAIGEIVLVMIGILLALQVNTWNEKNKQQKKEILLIEQIHEEFSLNKERIDVVLRVNQEMVNKCDSIIALFPIQINSENLDFTATQLMGIGRSSTFNPTYETIDALRSTSTFDLILDIGLRQELVKWTRLLEDYKEYEIGSLINHLQNIFQPFLGQNIPILPFNLQDSRFDTSILKSIQFENMIKTRRRKLSAVSGDHENIQKIVDAIEAILSLCQSN